MAWTQLHMHSIAPYRAPTKPWCTAGRCTSHGTQIPHSTVPAPPKARPPWQASAFSQQAHHGSAASGCDYRRCWSGQSLRSQRPASPASTYRHAVHYTDSTTLQPSGVSAAGSTAAVHHTAKRTPPQQQAGKRQHANITNMPDAGIYGLTADPGSAQQAQLA